MQRALHVSSKETSLDLVGKEYLSTDLYIVYSPDYAGVQSYNPLTQGKLPITPSETAIKTVKIIAIFSALPNLLMV